MNRNRKNSRLDSERTLRLKKNAKKDTGTTTKQSQFHKHNSIHNNNHTKQLSFFMMTLKIHLLLLLSYLLLSAEVQSFSSTTNKKSFINPLPSSSALSSTKENSSDNTIKRIAVFTSGGDCPSLNACIRAIYKTATRNGVEVYGLPIGLPSLMKDVPDVFELDESYGSTMMISKGGSRLGGFVASDYKFIDSLSMSEKVERISSSLDSLGIDGIIATGGDTSFALLGELLQNAGGKIPFVGIPKTIDNDIPNTIFSLGFDSAVSVATKAIADVRDTAESHRRIIVVECMGREAGFLTLHAGLAGGADAILLPEFPIDNKEEFAKYVQKVYDQNQCAIIAVSESITLPQTGEAATFVTADGRPRYGGSAEAIARFLSESLDVSARHIVLGHLQRSGSPTTFDKVLATNLGAHAVNSICDGKSEVYVTWNGHEIEKVSLDEIRGVASKVVTPDYPELITAKAMGIYCGC